ncbi:hypothetical protein [Bacillus inaquosorum]|uniref:hypothetical protein n=1 Tax=Bacillus inaquosorum TaxID=483913 RepID=UPI0022814016|nr:hypothetical protein [Bacillus inaquosorum]MCY7757798.1 hypothetical protein [Bacillus inaquosorum]MCY8731542.1 hypothetical protein [Bacillus inaquosorum]
MDVYNLKNHIIEKPEYIELILEETGFYNIDNRGNEYRCARKEGRNPTSVKINKTTLSATCYSTNLNGDLITLVKDKLGLTFPKTINKIAELIDYKDEEQYEPPKIPFGGFYKKIRKFSNPIDIDLETYSEDILDQFEQVPNMLFYEDGISPKTQSVFQIGYDSVTGRITVPWKTFSGELCGVMGRLNKKTISEDETKWLPIIPFPKSKTLYGFVENYSSIREKGIIMLGESEKHTMALSSKGLNVGVSLGGSFLSEVQANNIKSMFPKKSLIMMDEGLDEEHSLTIAKSLKFENFFKNEVGYIFDRENKYLPKGSKMAPADLDKMSLECLIRDCTVWI